MCAQQRTVPSTHFLMCSSPAYSEEGLAVFFGFR